MRFKFNFPDIGEGLEEGTILEWYVTKGQTVKVGESIVKMETDKIVADIPSPKNGTIVLLYGNVGDVIHVGSPLVEIELTGIHDEKPAQEEGEGKTEKGKTETQPITEPEDTSSVMGTMEVATKSDIMAASEEGTSAKTDDASELRKALATPVARAMAKEHGIDINKVIGSGPSGRVTRTDIDNFHSQSNVELPPSINALPPDQSGDVTYKPLTQIRKTIAKNMLQSKHSAAHMSVFEEIEISELINIRKKYKQRFADRGVSLTYLPFVVKAVAQALKYHQQLNSQIDTVNNRMIVRNHYNIAIAVDAPDGLVVPVIRDADKLSIFQIAKQIGELSEKARARKLTLEDMKNGSFTVTNFGSIGGIYATPVLNYPQAGILGIGRVLKTPIVKNDEIIVGNILPLSLTVDHRIVDGGEATRFIYKLMEYISDPVFFLLDD